HASRFFLAASCIGKEHFQHGLANQCIHLVAQLRCAERIDGKYGDGWIDHEVHDGAVSNSSCHSVTPSAIDGGATCLEGVMSCDMGRSIQRSDGGRTRGQCSTTGSRTSFD